MKDDLAEELITEVRNLRQRVESLEVELQTSINALAEDVVDRLVPALTELTEELKRARTR